MYCNYIFECVDGSITEPLIWFWVAIFGIALIISTFIIVAKEPGYTKSPMPILIIISATISAMVTLVLYVLFTVFVDYFEVALTASVLIIGTIASALAGKKVRDRNASNN